MPFVILDLDGVRTLLLCEGQLKRIVIILTFWFLLISFHVLTFGDDVLQSVPFVLGWHIASTFSARGQGTPWCYHPHPADQCAALDVAQEIYISFCLRFFRDAWAATYQYAFFSDDDEGFLVIQMAGSGLHRPAVLWMMFTFISCIDNDARANALRQAFVYFCQMILLFENCYVNTFFLLDLSHGSALFGHVAMVQGSWTPPKYHNVVACGPCFLCFSLIIAYTTRFLLLPAVEWYLPFSWCLC